MPSTPDSIILRDVQVDALDGPYDEPLDHTTDGFKSAAIFLTESGNDDLLAALWRDGQSLKFRDEANPGIGNAGFTLTEILAGAGGLTESAHEALDTLVHVIGETSYEEVTYAGSKISAITVWENDQKLKKIREELYVYTGSKITEITTNQYNAAGDILSTLVEAITYDGVKIASIDRVRS